jgi:hypothetical protein
LARKAAGVTDKAVEDVVSDVGVEVAIRALTIRAVCLRVQVALATVGRTCIGAVEVAEDTDCLGLTTAHY